MCYVLSASLVALGCPASPNNVLRRPDAWQSGGGRSPDSRDRGWKACMAARRKQDLEKYYQLPPLLTYGASKGRLRLLESVNFDPTDSVVSGNA